MIPIPDSILARVESHIKTYNLFRPREHVAIAFSGGKDSSFTACALRELGYDCSLIAVDMGYESSWAAAVSELASRLDLPLEVIPVRSDSFQKDLGNSERRLVQISIAGLDGLSAACMDQGSPCTACYNTKVAALNHVAEQRGLERIVFGHHATDAIASLLKSALMFVDRWDEGHEFWTREHFTELVHRLARDVLYANSSSLLKRVDQLVKERKAATDEPPRQCLIRHASDRELLRPLMCVFEHEIIHSIGASELAVQPSHCGHGATHETRTPREIVQFECLRELESTERGRAVMAYFYDLARAGLHSDGSLIVNVREARSGLLGPTYRPGMPAGEVKL